uniref:SAC3/GANP/THP3 conserved domain-containing protein n=1 Tax=Lygus hesperus TaxID=30085 RepID=A0A0A9XRB8_LYGHE
MSQQMERTYSRYEPKMEDIRPLSVLKLALVYVTTRAHAKLHEDSKLASMKYLNDQLKGIRQDLRVQNIVNNFTVQVYEQHARLALKMGELGEFNQCQASLRQFYINKNVDLRKCHVSEFFHYRLFYLYLSKQNDALSTELI